MRACPVARRLLKEASLSECDTNVEQDDLHVGTFALLQCVAFDATNKYFQSQKLMKSLESVFQFYNDQNVTSISQLQVIVWILRPVNYLSKSQVQ